MEETKASEFFDNFDFTIYKVKNNEGDIVYKLHDNQGANLGDIESDEFVNIEGAVNRLDMYYEDYIFRDIDDEIEIYQDRFSEDDKKGIEEYRKATNYEECIKALNKINNFYFDRHKLLLHYILNPKEIIDDVKFEKEIWN